MGLQFVGAATGTTSATLPSFNPGDIAIVFAYRDGNTTPPSLPTGWDNILNGGGSTNSGRSGSRVLQSGDTTTGTWTNATSVVVLVYRATDGTASIGASARQSGASTTITYPAITLQDAGGNSWGVRFAGHRSTNVAIDTAPSGFTNRTSVSDATDEAAGFDTNGGVTSLSSGTASVGGTSSGFEAHSIEIRFTPNPPSFTVQPTDQTVTEPAAATFNTTVVDADTYQWQFNDGPPPAAPEYISSEVLVLGTSASPGAQSVTVPSDATFCVVHWSGFMDGVNPGQLTGLTSNFGTFTRQQYNGAAIAPNFWNNAGTAYAEVTDTGSRTLTPTWTAALGVSPVFIVSYWKGVDLTDPVIDQDAFSEDDETNEPLLNLDSNTLAAVVALDCAVSGTPSNPTGWTSRATQTVSGGHQGRLRTVDSPGASTTAVESTLASFSTLSVISLRGTGGAWENVTDGTGGTSDDYTTPATTTAMSGRQYRLEATGPGGTTYSNTATLTVNAGGGGTAHELAANAAAQAAATAALGVTKPLAAAGSAQASATADLLKGVSLAAAGVANASASATMAHQVPLSAAAAAVASGGAQLALAVTLGANALAQAAASAGLAVGKALAAGGAAEASGTAGLQVTSGAELAANAQAQAGGTAVLSLVVSLSAAAVAQAQASAAIALGKPLSASGTAQAAGSAALQVSGSNELAASGQAQAGGSASLALDVPLSAAAIAQTQAAGSLTVVLVLNASALAQASGSAQLVQGVQLSAAGAVLATASAALTVVGEFARAPSGSGYSRPMPTFLRPARLSASGRSRFTNTTRPRR